MIRTLFGRILQKKKFFHFFARAATRDGAIFLYIPYIKIIIVNCRDTVHTIAMKLWEDVENTPGEVSALKTFSNSQGWRPDRARFVFFLYIQFIKIKVYFGFTPFIRVP